MNKDNAKDYLPLVQALAEGKTIQITLGDGEWLDLDDYRFDHHISNYRIKPEKKNLDVWVNIYPDNSWSLCAWGTRADADIGSSPHRIACKKITIEYEEGEGL